MTDADTVLADMMEQADFEQTGAAAEIFDLYTEADGAGREIIGTMFESFIGESFDTFSPRLRKHARRRLEPSVVGESLDEMMEQKVEVAGDGELGEELSMSNGER